MSTLQRVASLLEGGTPFALATVTWTRGPSSGKQGSKAIIFPDGTVEGWMGGACARPTLVREAQAALADGRSRLLLLGEDDHRPGVETVAMACSSEGAMEVFVEPMLPSPDLWIVGDSPACHALAQLAEVLEWRVHMVDEALEMSGVGPRSTVVVATQGHFDEPAMAAALSTEARYVGLVASAKRAAAVGEWLRAHGVDDTDVARMRAPAGMDLGSTGHREIAVAILAELVALGSAQPLEVETPALAVDPICGMSVDVATTMFVSTDSKGSKVYFCAAGCQSAWESAQV